MLINKTKIHKTVTHELKMSVLFNDGLLACVSTYCIDKQTSKLYKQWPPLPNFKWHEAHVIGMKHINEFQQGLSVFVVGQHHVMLECSYTVCDTLNLLKVSLIIFSLNVSVYFPKIQQKSKCKYLFFKLSGSPLYASYFDTSY